MQVHLGDGFEIHVPSNSMRGDRGDPDAARRQEAARHRRADARVDRVRGGAGTAGAGRRDRPDLVRPRDGDHREDLEAAPRTRRRAGDGRERSRPHRGRLGRDRVPLGKARWVPARDRVRAAGRAGRQLPAHPVGERRNRDPDQCLLAEGDRHRHAAPHAGARWWDRVPGLRCPRRVARLRLDGRREGLARVDHPVPGARSGPARDPGEHGVGRPAAHDRRQGDPRGSRRSPTGGATGRRSGGTRPTRRRSPTRSCSCSRTSRAGSPARWCTSTAATTRSGRRRPDPRATRARPASGARRRLPPRAPSARER